MALKAILTADEHRALPAHFQGEYKLDEKAGEYRLDVAPVKGWNLEDVAGLKTVLSEQKERHREAREKLAAFGELNPEQAREALAKLAALGDNADAAKLKAHIDGMTAQVESKYKGEIEKREKALSTLSQQLERQLVDGEVARLLSGATNPKLRGSFPLLIGAIRGAVKVEKVQTADGEGLAVRVMDQRTGAPLLSQKQGDNGPMGLEEYILSLRDRPEYAPAFAGTGASGAGSSGGASHGGTGIGLTELAKMAPDARIKFLRAQGVTK
jgi:hypothetical protein